MKHIGLELKYCGEILRIVWSKKVKNAEILQELNIGGDFLIDSVVTWRLDTLAIVSTTVAWKELGWKVWFLVGGAGADHCNGEHRTLKMPWA